MTESERGVTLNELLENALAFHHTGGDRIEARRLCSLILNSEDRQFEALHYFGVCEARRGQLEAACRLLTRALKINSAASEAHLNLGSVLTELRHFDDAMACFDRALALNPDYAQAFNNRGNVLLELKRYSEALQSYDRALALEPKLAKIHYNRGNALLDLKRYEESLASFDQASMMTPDDVEVLTNRGLVLYVFKRWGEALASYERALAIVPDFAAAWSHRANVLMDLNRPDEAFASWDRALAIKPDFAEALNNRGCALQKLQLHTEAIRSYEMALELEPDYEYLYGTLLHVKMQICDWSGIENQFQQLSEKIENDKKVSPPFFVIAWSDSLSLQRKAAEILVKDKYPSALALPERLRRPKHGKIKIGYFSADFRDHPISHLLVELLEKHDRSRFELTAFSFGPDTKDQVRARVEAAFDNFIDVRSRTDKEVAMLARQLEIDVAVDLGGFTIDSRTGIFAMRAAPLQINFLGYPATMGAEYIDYIFADTTLVPESHQKHYAEKIAYIPSYQPNDCQRRIADKVFTREELDLPETGFVFCCFNNSYKITPGAFDIWMRILTQVERSVLFLFAQNELVATNLKKEAARKGIDADRLIFGKRLPMPEHLARYRIADLFLDTFPCNAGATASDALWAGLPVLTFLGGTYAGRMAGSLLNALGLPELVASSLGEYEALALKLATDGKLLAEIKAKLARNRDTHPLFDTDRFRLHIESAYVTMWERNQRGEPPASFTVPAAG